MSFRLVSSVFLVMLLHTTQAQQLWGFQGGNPTAFYNISINCWCPECNVDDFIGPTQYDLDQGCSVTPNGNVFAMDDYNDIWQINTSTGAWSLLIDLPHSNTTFDLLGLAAGSNNIFYSINRASSPDTLYEINTLTGVVTALGPLSYGIDGLGEITFFEGILYYQSQGNGISKIILGDPIINEYVVDIPAGQDINTLTASTQCHTLFSFAPENKQFVLINTLDGDIINVGSQVGYFYGLTSLLEYQTPGCVTSLDLDCNDDSGATGYDFNSEDYYCVSEEGVRVSDFDILLLYDTLIEQMTIELTGTLPDGVNEYLELEQSFANLTITGSGSQMIILESDGTASSTNFKAALRAIRYHNSAFNPTLGGRIVNVNANTFYGTATNQATALIEVAYWPAYDVELGQDLQLCDEEVVMLNTQVEDADHIWSTNETTQSITVSDPGTYAVTVTGDDFCPAIDSIEISVVPNVFVELGNDIVVCEGEEATIELEVQSSLPLTIEIIVTPGNPLTYAGVISDIEIPVFATEFTSYVINSVTATEPACITIGDEEQIIDVNPGYQDSLSTGICEGDSISIGGVWIDEPGYYSDHLTTLFGCDSIVTHHVTFNNLISTFEEINTCVVGDTGLFIQVINNPNGCDTILEIHVQLGLLDTTYISSTTCRNGQEGIFTNVLTSSGGCDSVVVNTILLLAPVDTSLMNQVSCDSFVLGVFQNLLVNHNGCDSLVITTVSLGQPDTTTLFTTSCDSASLGVFEELFVSQLGCDSTVFTTVTYSPSDSTFIQDASCDPDDVGVFVDSFVNRFGCDSIVTTEVSYAISHYINLSASTCNPADTGTFIQTLTNQYGCDSIVTTTVELLPSDDTFLFSTTCMSSEAGMFITTHLNQYGCDSTVTLTVSLVPADTTILSFKTCDPTQVGNIEKTYTNIDGCDSLVIEQTTLYPLPELQLSITSDYNGYAISCFGESDGSAIAEVNGVPPLTYLWSTGAYDQTITGLSAGSYALTVTDGNGCTSLGEVNLFEPEEFSISFIVSQPDCFDHQDGSITVEQSGGIEPIKYSIDEINYQSSPIFDNLPGGTYTVTAIDANDCEVKEIIWINVPLMVHVELPGDQMAFPGDTVIINAIVNVPYDSLASVVWSGLNNPVCPTCLSQPVAPIITTTYSVTVTSLDGCSDEDAMTLFLESDTDVYVPNIFSPNGDGVNDGLFVYAGPQVEEISSFIIFDRWGNVVFADEHCQPSDASRAWDGRFKEKDLNPGVFAYRMIVEFVSGRQDVLYGDVTLVR